MNSKKSPQPRNLVIECVLIFAILSGLFYFLFGLTFQAQFALIDDHEIPRIASSEATMWELAIKRELDLGRVRPVYYLFRFAESTLFGVNPQAWHIATTGLGVLTCFLFYIALRSIGADVLSSLFFILLFTMTGPQNVIWCQLGPAETVGMLLTAIAVWGIANAASQGKSGVWDGLALVAMALAGLTKESFVLLMPALLLLRWTLHRWFNQESWPQALRTLRLPLGGGLLLFIGEILIIVVVMLYKPEGYGATTAGLSLNSFDPRGWYDLLTSSELSVVTHYLPLFCTLILAVCWPEKKLARPCILAGSPILIAWVVPQLVLYGQGLVVNCRYLFPAIVGPAAVVAFGLAVVWQRRLWILWIPCAIWLSLALFAGARETIQRASAYTADTVALHKMVTYLAQNVKASEAIVITADPAYKYEPIFSVRAHLRYAGSESSIHLWPLFPEGGYPEERFQHLAEDMIARFPNLETFDPNHIGGIIALTPPLDSSYFHNLPAGFIPTHWQEKIFAEPYYAFSLRELEYVEVGKRSYTVLERSSGLDHGSWEAGESLSQAVGHIVSVDTASSGQVLCSGQANGWLVFGPQVWMRPGSYNVMYRLGLGEEVADEVDIATIDVVTDAGNHKLAERVLMGADFEGAGNYKLFVMPMQSQGQPDFEFRVFTHGKANLCVDTVSVEPLQD